jgi:hypothetical protein
MFPLIISLPDRGWIMGVSVFLRIVGLFGCVVWWRRNTFLALVGESPPPSGVVPERHTFRYLVGIQQDTGFVGLCAVGLDVAVASGCAGSAQYEQVRGQVRFRSAGAAHLSGPSVVDAELAANRFAAQLARTTAPVDDRLPGFLCGARHVNSFPFSRDALWCLPVTAHRGTCTPGIRVPCTTGMAPAWRHGIRV